MKENPPTPAADEKRLREAIERHPKLSAAHEHLCQASEIIGEVPGTLDDTKPVIYALIAAAATIVNLQMSPDTDPRELDGLVRERLNLVLRYYGYKMERRDGDS